MNNRGAWGALALVLVASFALWLYTREARPPSLPVPPSPSPPAAGPPPQVLADLARGVNLSNWLQQGKPAEPGRYAPDDADWERIRALGLTHARILFDPAALLDERGFLRPAALASLREAIAGARVHGVLVVLALQLPDAFKAALADDRAMREALAGTWRAVASALGDVPADALVLEPLNESGIDDPARARELTAFLVAQLRAVLPKHTLAVAGHKYSGVDELTVLQPLDDANLVYTFHFYEPHNFTHQGATWGDPAWRALHDLPYPSSPERVAPLLARASPALRKLLQWHGEQRWDREKLGAAIAKAAAWGQQHHVPVWCSEFGVIKKRVAAADRAAWLRDVREALEAHHIAWTHWDYAGPFGLVSGATGHRVPDGTAVKALGLNP